MLLSSFFFLFPFIFYICLAVNWRSPMLGDLFPCFLFPRLYFIVVSFLIELVIFQSCIPANLCTSFYISPFVEDSSMLLVLKQFRLLEMFWLPSFSFKKVVAVIHGSKINLNVWHVYLIWKEYQGFWLHILALSDIIKT